MNLTRDLLTQRLGTSPSWIQAERLLAYLRSALRLNKLVYRALPESIPFGWEASTSAFELTGPSLSARFARPLILRQYSSAAGEDRLRHEFAVQSELWAAGFPVAEPLLLERDADLLGGPFMLMARAEGPLLCEVLERLPHRLYDLPARMAELLARLHALPIDNCHDNGRMTPDLDGLREGIEVHRLDGLRAGLDWLARKRPAPPERPSRLHLDYHPLNLICRPRGMLVLDWERASIGDPHADLASTSMLVDRAPLRSFPSQRPDWLVSLGRGILRRRFLRAYCRLTPGWDRSRYHYYRAWAALDRLFHYGRVIVAGPSSIGSMPSAARNVSASYIDHLCRDFERRTGVGVRLPARPVVDNRPPARKLSSRGEPELQPAAQARAPRLRCGL